MRIVPRRSRNAAESHCYVSYYEPNLTFRIATLWHQDYVYE